VQSETSYFRLTPRGTPAVRPTSRSAFKSVMRPRQGESVLSSANGNFWLDRLAEYKLRKSAAHSRLAAAGGPPAPVVPGGRNWSPLGPTVVLNGQTVGNEPVGGRTPGLAIAPGGMTVYAATACGGVFRSDDGGISWRSLMDGFDIDPTNFASTSLACGAIAIDKADPSRVYVGTGEGDTYTIFKSRIVGALPSYRGIGPIRSDDGGSTWTVEPTAAASPMLAGEAFFAIAVDPSNRETVFGATTAGLYQRVPKAGGGFEWRQERPSAHSSVAVARSGGTTRVIAAQWGDKVYQSTNGSAWTVAGIGFPTANVGRIALAVQPDKIDVVYAFVSDSNGLVMGVFRLDDSTGSWNPISNSPDVIPSNSGSGQGDYDLAITVDPQDSNLIYLGGSYANVNPYPGSVWRCSVQTTPAGFQFSSTASIGTHAHADVHCLVHSPGDPDELWCGCDGGVFLNRAPRGNGEFAGMNSGLSSLCSNFIGQHPTDPNIVFTGLQDNGTARTSGGPAWSRVNSGDGGYCLVNWANPDKVLTYANGRVFRSVSGGATDNDWTIVWDSGWATMTQPIVSPRYDANHPAFADWVAVGAGPMVYISNDFGTSWPTKFALPGGASAGSVFALGVATPLRFFIGTTNGRIFRADKSGNAWTVTRLDNVAAGAIGLDGLISDVAIDWADATFSSIYVAFGGIGDPRHVWWFDGTAWQPRSGTDPSSNLLDVEHNAIVVDATAPGNVYVGADIGVWHSVDRGATWQPLENGLPDAAVFDVRIHPTQRLLRAATYGRGVYELALQ
jgi:hypothetical protein